MSTLRFFKPEEFACKCGCGRGYDDMDAGLLRMLDEARALAGIPFSLSSAFRCAKHNKAVGGVYNSRHLLGQAMDFHIPGMTAAQILALVRQQPEAAYCYAIDSRHVHMDVV